jgi:F-type H+-transporting ATPase subunit b
MATNESIETAVGMPQLDFATFPNQAFWLLVFVTILFFMVKILIMPRMEETLTNRRKLIEEDLQEAEILRNKAREIKETISVELDASRTHAAEMARHARDQVKKNTRDALSEIDIKVKEMVDESAKRIEALRKSADKEVDLISKQISKEIVKKILL